MHRRLQFGMRENRASERRHDSPAIVRALHLHTIEGDATAARELPMHSDLPAGDPHAFPHAGSHEPATGRKKTNFFVVSRVELERHVRRGGAQSRFLKW